MKRSSPYIRNQIEQMPIYNRAHGQGRWSGSDDIALSTHKKQQIFLEKEIKPEDTLQSVALEFNVSVAELKRINNIHKENEIYARTVIKVPSNPLSLLLEKEYFPESSINSDVPAEPIQDTSDSIIETINNSNVNPRIHDESPQEEEHHQNKHSYLPLKTDEEDESVSLLNTTIEPGTNDVITCNGADWGISWPILIFLTIVVGVGGPVLYIFWVILSKNEKPSGS